MCSLSQPASQGGPQAFFKMVGSPGLSLQRDRRSEPGPSGVDPLNNVINVASHYNLELARDRPKNWAVTAQILGKGMPQWQGTAPNMPQHLCHVISQWCCLYLGPQFSGFISSFLAWMSGMAILVSSVFMMWFCDDG